MSEIGKPICPSATLKAMHPPAAPVSEMPASAAGQLPVRADLNLLRTFLAVYRAGTLTAAAPRLALSQSTVTTQIRTLEQQTGRSLFTRLVRCP